MTEDALILTRATAAGDQLVLKRLADGAETPLGAPHAEDQVRMVADPHRGTLLGRGFGNDVIRYEWYDAELGNVQAGLARVFPGLDAQPLDWSRDRTRFIVWVQGLDTPLAWYLFDKTQRSASPIGQMYPDLAGVRLGQTKWITYRARDGLEIPAYVTLPPGAVGGGPPLPLVVLPHDRFDGRDRPDFDYLTEFLATRGYAVLRAQYRGSGGLGAALRKAGDRQWGSGVQTDLLDGVAALAAQGVIDPKRVCIVGEGFGGYAALAGVTLHPDAYACAVSISGVSNLKVVLARSGPALRPLALSLSKIPFRDPLYDAGSPNLHAAEAKAPILLVSVDQDAVIPTEQTQLMREALTAAHKPFEDLVLKDTDHDLGTTAARTRMLQAIEAFLAKNLPTAAP